MHQGNSEDVEAWKRTELDFWRDSLGLFSEAKTVYIFRSD